MSSDSTTHRIDARLIHATLIEAWVPYVGARHLVVADRSIMHDARRRTIFEMSARDVDNTHFVPESAVAGLLSALPSDEPTIVVYGGLREFDLALQGGLTCAQVLVGHLPDGEHRRRVHPSVYVGHAELEWVERIVARGVEVVVRPLPSDQARGLRRGEDGRPVLSEDPTSMSTADLSPVVSAGEVALAEEPVPKPPASKPTRISEGGPREGSVQVVNERGLHLRAAHVLAQCAGRFESLVELGWTGRMVNAKSLLGITTLGAAQGTQLSLRVQGPDSDEAYDAVVALFESGFEEGSA